MNKRIRKKRGLPKIQTKELWSLDYTLTKFILPRLIKFRELDKYGLAHNVKTMDEWNNIIDKMIWSFKKHLKDDWNLDNLEEENKRFNDGMKLFAEYYCDLWD